MHRTGQPFMSANPLDVFSAHSRARELAGIESAFRPERRKRARTQVHWRVLFLRDGGSGAVETITQNLSSIGFYCFSDVPLMAGEYLRCIVSIPSHDPSGHEKARLLECRIRVTRVEPGAVEGTFGIACQIQDYHLAVSEEHREAARHDH